MTDFNVVLFFWLCGATIIALLSPRKYQLDVMALATLLLFASFAWISTFWMLATAALTYAISTMSKSVRQVGVWSMVLAISFMFVTYKSMDNLSGIVGFKVPVLLGLAYFFCRQVHLLIDSLKDSSNQLTLRQHLQYNFFLPVMMGGPIHRSQHFFRQNERRRIETANFSGGLERILYGYSKIIIGNYLITKKLAELLESYAFTGFPTLFIESAINWLYLYLQFSGFADIALGFSLLLGLKLEENFNNPLTATTLIDFWQRWHITLSSWCRDYVFSPVQAATRSQFGAVLVAMIVMGIWHDFSLYFILWGVYHATGISLCRIYQKANDPLKLDRLPVSVKRTITRVATFGWLISCMPVVSSILAYVNVVNV